MVKCSIAKTLTMKHFTGFQDMLFYSCPVPPEEREKLDAFLLLLEKSNAWKYLNGCNTKVEPGRPKIDECKLFAAMLYCFVLGKASLRVISLKYANGLRNGANSDTHRCKQLTEHGEERCIKLREVAGFSAVRTIFQIVGPRKILHCLLGK